MLEHKYLRTYSLTALSIQKLPAGRPTAKGLPVTAKKHHLKFTDGASHVAKPRVPHAAAQPTGDHEGPDYAKTQGSNELLRWANSEMFVFLLAYSPNIL